MRILIIGQTSLHWGRMEFGNIGNYYVMEPFFKELRRIFPEDEIRTTIQMSDKFCSDHSLIRLPLEYYYSWDDDDYLMKCYYEYGLANYYNVTGKVVMQTPFINEVISSDLVIDMSGDVWGDNADYAGNNRFLVGLLKDRVAQLMNNHVVMISGSPGPFSMHQNIHSFTKEVFCNFGLVTNREPVSEAILKQYNLDTSKVENYACPAFLFEGYQDDTIGRIISDERIVVENRQTAGFILCGWNMLEGPYSKWPRSDDEYSVFIDAIEYMIEVLNLRVALISHNNGFELEPKFKLIHGRDYPIAEQLFHIIKSRNNVTLDDVVLVDGVYTPKQMISIIGHLDMLVSGRVHGSVAGLTQFVPTVMIDYGHEPKAHKVQGFAKLMMIEKFLANPLKAEDLIDKIQTCWHNRKDYRSHLHNHIPKVRYMAHKNFDRLREYADYHIEEK